MIRKRTMTAGIGIFYPIVGFASLILFLYVSFRDISSNFPREAGMDFVKRNGTQLTVDGGSFYINGWNSYWLLNHAVEEYNRPKIRAMLRAGASMGLTVCRTWAFNDGAYNALQISPGKFDERVFKALDHIIVEAKENGVRLLLSLVNNLQAYGGKTQYVKWAWQEGIGLSSSNDSFFFDPTIRHYYKNYVKVVLTRRNSVTGIQYKDDPTIFAWELMNEPRCMSDPSGDTLQDWINEMAVFVKSIDDKHLLTVGLEGFYGPNNPKSSTVNPGQWAATLGSDFVRVSKISAIDFASVHLYPDHWLHDEEFEEKLKYVSKWMESHVEDAEKELQKPVLFTEFGLSSKYKGFLLSQRDQLYETVNDFIYNSAKGKGAAAGSLVWQFLVGGMEEYDDGFGIVPWERPSTYDLITRHSCRLTRANQPSLQNKSFKELCSSNKQQV